MKKCFLTIVIIVSFIGAPFAQNHVFDWANPLKGDGNVDCSSSVTDSIGNIYTIGEFEGAIDFDLDNSTPQLISNGESDIFILKSDSSGNFLWVKQFGSNSLNQGWDLSIDINGDIVCSGSFLDTLVFESFQDTLISNGLQEILIFKLDPSGTLLWYKHIGGNSYDRGITITTDLDENILISGTFRDTVDFDPGPDTNYLFSNDSRDVFILKLNTEGNFLWVKQIGGPESENCYSIKTDLTGNIYTTGEFEGDVDFDPGTDTNMITNAGNFNIFIQKLDLSGNLLWAKSYGVISARANSMNIDINGDVYIVGDFWDSLIIDFGTEIDTLISDMSRDIFILKLDSQGNPIWVKQAKGPEHDWGNSITSDSAGNVYIFSDFGETVDFDPGLDTTYLVSNGYHDLSILKLDASGNFLWAKQMGGPSPDLGRSITIDIFGNLITTGHFQNIVDFDPGSDIMYLNADGQMVGFIQKLKLCSSNLLTASTSSLPDLTGQCSIPFPTIPTAVNECEEIFIGIPNISFPITDQSITEVIWSYSNENSFTQSQYIIWDEIVTTTTNGFTITAKYNNALYQWVNCDSNYALIEGETQQSFTSIEDGNYAVIVDNGTCIDTSDCINLSSVNINKIRNSGIVLMPNPVENILMIKSPKTINTLVLIDNSGRTIKQFRTNVNTYKMDMYDLVSGIYYIKIITNDFVSIEKIIKQ